MTTTTRGERRWGSINGTQSIEDQRIRITGVKDELDCRQYGVMWVLTEMAPGTLEFGEAHEVEDLPPLVTARVDGTRLLRLSLEGGRWHVALLTLSPENVWSSRQLAAALDERPAKVVNEALESVGLPMDNPFRGIS